MKDDFVTCKTKATKGLLPRSFFLRDTCAVAQDLLGCWLVRIREGVRLSGVIVETEAYVGEKDLACHARAGLTPRTEVMYGMGGFSYVYFTYGMHWLLNVTTEKEGFPAAVLIRALEPQEGVTVMRVRRGVYDLRSLCSGPARLAQALGIGKAENGLDLCSQRSGVWLEDGLKISREQIVSGPRVGISRTPEPWRSKPWRYFVQGNSFVSKDPTTSRKSRRQPASQ